MPHEAIIDNTDVPIINNDSRQPVVARGDILFNEFVVGHISLVVCALRLCAAMAVASSSVGYGPSTSERNAFHPIVYQESPNLRAWYFRNGYTGIGIHKNAYIDESPASKKSHRLISFGFDCVWNIL